MIELELPYPPSVNHYWRRVGARTLISRGGRAFRQAVCSILAAHGIRPLAGPLEMVIDVYPPDRRRRDLDNLQKALLDALAHGGAYHDDSQIDRLTVQRRGVAPDGMVRVRLRPLGAQEQDRGLTEGDMKPKPRTCLKCGRTFASSGPSNRICGRCARVNARIPVTEEQLKQQRGVKRLNGEILGVARSDGRTDR